MKYCNIFDILTMVSHMTQFRRGAGNITTKLAAVRKAKGMTQRKLSYLSGVHRVSIARYETGRVSPNARVLEKLADALGVPIDDIVGRKAG